MQQIYYDPITFEWVPSLKDYTIKPYNRHSYMINKTGDDGVNIVDLEDYDGSGSCTCADFAYRHDPTNQIAPSGKTCKHIRLVKYILRIQTKKI